MRYFAMIDGAQRGPATLSELAEMGLRPDTYVWCKGMDDWKQADEVADICRFYRQRLSTLPAAVESPQEEAPGDDAYEELPLRFRGMIRDSGTQVEPGAPESPDLSKQPRFHIAEAIALTILCCPLTGLVAIYCALATRRLWKNGQHTEAHDFARKTKMWLGITFFMGFLVYAFLSKIA